MSTENLLKDEKDKIDKKEKAIQDIVQQGVVTPLMRFESLRNRMKICNMKTAFYGINDCIFLGIMTGMIFWFLFLQVDTELIGCGVYLLSPFVYMVIYSMVLWKEMTFQLYEMKMVCRYHLQLLSTFRMLYFSVINLVWNSGAILLMQYSGAKSVAFWKLMGISFSATFLYGISLLLMRWTRRTMVSQWGCTAIWLLVNSLLVCLGGKRVESFLMNLPGYLLLGVACASGMLYLSMLLLNMSKKLEGEREYAFH